MPRTVLVAIGDESIGRDLCVGLEAAGFRVLRVNDGTEAWSQVLATGPALVITDFFSSGSPQRSFAERVLLRAGVEVLVLSARRSVRQAVAAIKAGAIDYLVWEDHSVAEIVTLVSRSFEGEGDPESILEEILVGESALMRRLRERVQSLSSLRAPVLLSGEPGTGRSTVSRAIHELGRPASGAMQTIDCGSNRDARPGNVQLSESASGAVLLRGFEQLTPAAHSDWVELLARQPTRHAPLTRVFASSDQPLHALRRSGIHPGLLRHLMVYSLELPAMREIRSDIAAIADAIMMRIRREIGRSVSLEPEARRMLQHRDWPGNAAELYDTLARASVFSRSARVGVTAIEGALGEATLSIEKLRHEHAGRQRERLISTLRDCGGNKAEAARRMGIHRNAVYRLMQKYGVQL